METQLILVDGISGSGKSTTAQFLAIQLERNGKNVRWFHEEQSDNPLFCEDNETINNLERLQQFINTTLEQWQLFVQTALASGTTFIIESYIFQNTIRMLFQNNVGREEILHFAKQVLETIRPLHPKLIYLRKASVEASLHETWTVRGAKWKAWSTGLDSRTPFAMTRKLQGEDAALTLWSEYQGLTDQLFQVYELPKLAIENSAGDWNHYHQEMLDFLGLSYSENPLLTPDELARFCGYYEGINPDKDLCCTITLEAGQLMCLDFLSYKVRMLPVTPTKFYLEAQPVELYFDDDASKIILDGNSSISGEQMLRF